MRRTTRRLAGIGRPADESGSPPTCDATRLRLVVADEQAIDRKGLICLLHEQPDFEVVGEAEYGTQAIQRCRDLQPHVLVLDTRVSDPSISETIPTLMTTCPETHVLAVAGRSAERCLILNPPLPNRSLEIDNRTPCSHGMDCLQLAIACGASGAIRRCSAPEELFRAIRALASGHPWYEPGTAARLLDPDLRLAVRDRARSLSAREKEVAALISGGRSNKEIARLLGVTEPTVKKHVGHILCKLDLQDRLQLGLLVARNPLVLSESEPDPA